MGQPNENNKNEQVKTSTRPSIRIRKWKNTAPIIEMSVSVVSSLACAIAAAMAISIATGAIGVAALPAFLGFIGFFANAPAIISLVLVVAFSVAHAVSVYQQMYKNEELAVGIEGAKTLAEGAEGHSRKAGEYAQAAEKSKGEAEAQNQASKTIAENVAKAAIRAEGTRLLGDQAKVMAKDVATQEAKAVVGDMAQTAVKDAVNGVAFATTDQLNNATKELVKANELEGKIKNSPTVTVLEKRVGANEVKLNGDGTKNNMGLVAQVTAVEGRVTINETSHTALKKTVMGDGSTDTGISGKVTDLGNRVKTAEETLAGPKNGKSLTQQVTDNEQAITDLEGVVGKTTTDGLRKEVAGLTVRVGANEAKIAEKADSADNINEANFETKAKGLFPSFLDDTDVSSAFVGKFNGLSVKSS
ncbi:hypothetical protein [Wolbachia endosymbiont of Folsomia candida]|uniref:hypothetical protein n=1 Tax=Wolbachia endosymbiont of Folsomia candida TaxID=169402 RepID=UPI000A796F62|nr:hypothetical protein [Wolbachia endosymbiont of Folsomia candida]APR98136.1 hypothetical protein ASM33_02375 [Wolbachia endosymbiont of Folsomia candida]